MGNGKKGAPTKSRAERIDQMRIEATVGPITLASGVVVMPKAVSPLLISAAVTRIQKPKVPRQFIEDKGREEENPMHPDYLAAMDAYTQETGELNQRIMLMLGTEIISVPEGIPAWDSDEWIEALAFTGLEIPQAPRERRQAWLRYIAMPSLDDLKAVTTAINRLSGIPEEAVQAAAQTFRGEPAR